MSDILTHEIRVHQKIDGKPRTAALMLSEKRNWFAFSSADGKWKQGKIFNYADEDVNLHRHAPMSELELHYWTYDSSTFEIRIGKWNPLASHKKGEERIFVKWFTLYNVQRLASLSFMAKSTYLDGTQLAQFELSTSSANFSKEKPCYWEIVKTSS